MFCDLQADAVVYRLLKLGYLLASAQDLIFEFFEFWRDETFGIDQSLFALELWRHFFEVRP